MRIAISLSLVPASLLSWITWRAAAMFFQRIFLMRKYGRLKVEQLESRLMLHAGPPPLGDEHAYFESLLPEDHASHVAVRNGNWSDRSTWQGGILPSDHAKVLIPERI